MYGLRTAGPIAIGIAKVKWLDFALYNALGATAWALVFTALGYVFGQTIAVFIGEMVHYEMLAVGAIVAGGAAVWGWHRTRRAP